MRPSGLRLKISGSNTQAMSPPSSLKLGEAGEFKSAYFFWGGLSYFEILMGWGTVSLREGPGTF